MGNENQSLSHTKWKCKSHILFAPKYRVELQYILDMGKKRSETWELIWYS